MSTSLPLGGQDEPAVIVDGHEDLALNALVDGRDYLGSAHAIRAAERGAGVEEANGRCMLGLAEWLEARVAVIVATVMTIPRPFASPGELSYATIQGAHQQALAQLDLYRRWAETSEQIVPVRTREELDGVLATWADDRAAAGRRVGLVLSIENADPIRTVEEVAFWAEQGVRVIGPAWHANRYSGDTRAGGPLTALGRELLGEMGRLGLALDLTHMSDEASLEALATYEGTVVASHANARRTVPIERLLPDRAVEGIVERDGIVGVLPLNWALDPGWRRPAAKDAVSLRAVVDAIDVVCQIAGDVRHVGLGTDFDGGAGAESAPAELDTIADLPLLAGALAERGYAASDVAAIMGGNWLRLLRRQLP